MVKPSIQRHCRKTPETTNTKQKSTCNIQMPFRPIYLHENWKSSKMKITWFNLEQFTFRAAHTVHQFDWLWCLWCARDETHSGHIVFISWWLWPIHKTINEECARRWKRRSPIWRMLDGNVNISDCISQVVEREREKGSENDGKCAKWRTVSGCVVQHTD